MRVRLTKTWRHNFPDDKGFDRIGNGYDEDGTSCDRCSTSINHTVDVVHTRNKQTATVGTRCAKIVTRPYSKNEIMEFVEGDLIGIDPYTFNQHWETIDQNNGRLYRYEKLKNANCEILEKYNGAYCGKIVFGKPLNITQRCETNDPTDIQSLRKKLFKLYQDKVSKIP